MENKCCVTEASKEGCCWMTVFKGALVGGIVIFIYLAASWMYCPWHKDSIMMFKNEKIVSAALSGNIEKSGVYVLAGVPEAAVAQPATAKPFAFVSVYQKGTDGKTRRASRYKSLLFCLFAGALLTKLLKKSAGSCCPVFFSMTAGLLVGSFQYLPNMIWYHFPVNYSLMGMLDDFLAVTLAGFAISKIVLGSGACTGGKAAVGKPGDKKGCCH